jgi:hypothetical protein
MHILTTWELEELNIVKEFENKALNLDLSDPGNEEMLLNLIKNAYERINDIDTKYAEYLYLNLEIPAEILFIKTKDFHAQQPMVKLKIPQLLENKNIDLLREHFGDNSEERYSVFVKFMDKITFSYDENKLDKIQQQYIPKICVDIFKLLKSPSAVALLSQLINLERNIKFTFFGEKLAYQPNIKTKVIKSEKKNINDPGKREKKSAQIDKQEVNNFLKNSIYSAEESIAASENLLNLGTTVLGQVEFSGMIKGAPCSIVFNTELASIKTATIKQELGEKVGLSYCPRFISTAHELIHIAHIQNNSYYKDIPLENLPLIKFTYSNFEELYTIKLDKKFSENQISLELNYSQRITHSGGFATPISKYTDDKKHIIAMTLKEALIKGGLMSGKLELATPKIASYYNAAQDNSQKVKEEIVNDAYASYQLVFFDASESNAEKQASSVFNAPSALFSNQKQEDKIKEEGIRKDEVDMEKQVSKKQRINY